MRGVTSASGADPFVDLALVFLTATEAQGLSFRFATGHGRRGTPERGSSTGGST
jgi:hypothetical protein